ncbi:hypothetical protein Tco_0469223 [Tanacetum coccineum]
MLAGIAVLPGGRVVDEGWMTPAGGAERGLWSFGLDMVEEDLDLDDGWSLCRAARASAGRHNSSRAATWNVDWHTARGQILVASMLYIFLLSSRGRLNQVNLSSYAQVMAKMVEVFILQLNLTLSLSRDLEACMVDSFALEMLSELILDAGFFVLVLSVDEASGSSYSPLTNLSLFLALKEINIDLFHVL